MSSSHRLAALVFLALTAAAPSTELPTYTRVVASSGYLCALKKDGAVWCWEDPFNRPMGRYEDRLTSREAPVLRRVNGLPEKTVELAAGSGHVCALLADHSVWCWGNNAEGQLGNGELYSDVPEENYFARPTKVAVLGNSVVAIAAANTHSCAIRDNGAVWCWGDNGCGRSSGASHHFLELRVPYPIAALGSSIKKIWLNGQSACALNAQGTFTCMTALAYGCRQTVKKVTTITPDVQQLALGAHQSCAIEKDRSLKCWLEPDAWTPDEPPYAPLVSPLGQGQKLQRVAASSGEFLCAVEDEGALWCWGDARKAAVKAPIKLTMPDRGSSVRIVEMALSRSGVLAILSDGTLWHWPELSQVHSAQPIREQTVPDVPPAEVASSKAVTAACKPNDWAAQNTNSAAATAFVLDGEDLAIPIMCRASSGFGIGGSCLRAFPQQTQLRLENGRVLRATLRRPAAGDDPFLVQLRMLDNVRALHRNNQGHLPILAAWPATGDVRAAPTKPEWPITAQEAQQLRKFLDPQCKGKLVVRQAFKQDLDGDGAAESVYTAAVDANSWHACDEGVWVRRGETEWIRLGMVSRSTVGPLTILGTLDLDRNGRRELVIYYPPAGDINAFTVHTYEWPCPRPVARYHFSEGNGG